MSVTISVPLSAEGLDRAVRELDAWRTWLEARTRELLGRLSQEGLSVASARFARAVYDGTNDVSVRVERRSEDVRAIVAVGRSVLFIEFGTGVVYPDDHPEAGRHGMVRGGYGRGQGKRRTWSYYGDPGTNGVVHAKADGRTVVSTQGNPANKPMYETARDLEERIGAMAREVFGA